ncbi:MAG: hypothetical protein A3C27_00290 [Candidatus Levybacteria bacterium RIFCSPHIGHO2_02_FULL_39_36]|nr:MAG: hypothetical protein UT20_C0058G0001 [Candidatus Levybacteria bacterium GW2011_GWA1_39_11]OGH28661.1 MAG: hypothetical protein A3C27_00290 [Candidatus Levybacteria bacterium RIFCSPHIGHO2_02_FULL_39_36]OGH47420.1 MAG: hypothetical protein A3G66_00880 [Candidatus Levybacteria bacterium RIFCSPLOWO2_12_FULL_39_17]
MAKTIIGVFPDKETADHAVDEFIHYGYRNDEISLVMKNGLTGRKHGVRYENSSSVTEGTVTGVATGGIIGGLTGLFIGAGLITIPGIGALLVAGPIAAALGLSGIAATTVSGAITGALAGGLVGGLIGLGIPEQEARLYEETIREGGVLLAVPVVSGQEKEVRELFLDNGAENIRILDTNAYQDEEEFREYYSRNRVGAKGGKRKIRDDKFDDEF